ncbi:MAG TPA: N-acetyl-gamma-glutamyl-phosphate reductase [Bacteroidota bacterium]|nr:N-acetyl-gamma-glutamyl-phosphate reductase [Bacteroidota bacterium]
MTEKTISVSIVGASGYSGAELTKILLRHKHVRLATLFANSSAGKKVAEVYPWFAGRVDAVYEQYTVEAASSSDITFIALPSGEAMNIVPELLERGKRVIDLGGDFRFNDAALYEKYYKHQHTAAGSLPRAVFGLPEWNRAQIASASLIANPGCYATSAILPLAPVLKAGIVQPRGITISSLSGVSGAGRSAKVDYSFTELNESVRAYKVGVHQHTPEIKTVLESISGKELALTFVPHLLPITRGIYTSIYAPLAGNVTQSDVLATFQQYYGREPFVRISDTAIPEIKNVNHTNYIDIGFRVYTDNNQLIILSVIDNLIKGAAGQAVQNMNLMFGFEETEGLLS